MKPTRLSIRHVWVGLTLAAAFVGPASSPIGVPDIFWTLLSGDWMIRHRARLDIDPFTSAPHVAEPLHNQQWLADVLYQGCYLLGGLPMVIVATALVVAVTYGLVLAAADTASGHLRLSCAAVWVAYALGASNLNPRPQTLAYPLFGLFLLAIVRAECRKDTRLLWLLPPATAVWANLHGSFFTGLALLGCALVGRSIVTRSLYPTRAYGLTLVACVLASLVNPYGFGSLASIASIGSNSIVRDHVTEWAPTAVSSQDGVLFFLSLVLVGGLALKSRLRLSPLDMLTLLVFGYLAWSSVRAIVWWGLAITPILARLAGSVLPSPQPSGRDRPLINATILAGILGMVLVSLPWVKASLPFLPADKQGVLGNDVPVGAGEYLRTHDLPGNRVVFDEQLWGGYLEWATWPRHQVFVDGRFELHPQQVWLDYLDIVFPSARWAALLDQYQVGSSVLSTADHPDLVADLRANPTWRVDYEDDQAIVFSRAPSAEP